MWKYHNDDIINNVIGSSVMVHNNFRKYLNFTRQKQMLLLTAAGPVAGQMQFLPGHYATSKVFG